MTANTNNLSQITDDEEDYNTMTNPPYYCDGGCGKKVGEGWDHECVRVCPDCTVENKQAVYLNDSVKFGRSM